MEQHLFAYRAELFSKEIRIKYSFEQGDDDVVKKSIKKLIMGF